MSTSARTDNGRMAESAWERLYRLVEQRRARLDLTLNGIQATGGPSPKWVQNLRGLSGPPTPRMRASLMDLDRALRWKVGTSWELVEHDRSAWSEDLLRDEEESLLDMVDEANNFGFVVAARLRSIPEGPARDEVMRRILDVLGIRP